MIFILLKQYFRRGTHEIPSPWRPRGRPPRQGRQKTAGGIIIPETAQEKPQEGEIIAVGPGALDDNGKRVPLEVKAGDFVLFGKWSGTEVKIDGEELLIMKESDIMGIIEGRKAEEVSAAGLKRRLPNLTIQRIQENNTWQPKT